MSKNINYNNLNDYNKIIVYGAGELGIRFLRVVVSKNIDASKVIVWDANYSRIKERISFKVLKPDFSYVEASESILVVIALCTKTSLPVVNEMKQKFLQANYKNVIDIDAFECVNSVNISTFEDLSYNNCYYQENEHFSDAAAPPVKPIAFYLPQFHEIPENNEWWGEGFTEWTNTSKAKPRFKGHYQPREPHDDFGYYDLSDADVIRKQAKLAKQHGIYGWSIYYYWFSGKTLLTTPIDLLLANKDIDINFCLTWCNNSWTKSWVGDDKKTLMCNNYADGEPEKFIDDIAKYLRDDRYIKINGKPLIIIHKIQDIPDAKKLISAWRKRAEEIGIGAISVFSAVRPFLRKDMHLQDYIDGDLDFCMTDNAVSAFQLLANDGSVLTSSLFDYNDVFSEYRDIVESRNEIDVYLNVTSGFDNSARYDSNYWIYNIGFSNQCFYDMVKYVVDESIARNNEYFFIFAWNEWAETAYLEPDKRFGYSMINTFSKALYGLPLKEKNL